MVTVSLADTMSMRVNLFVSGRNLKKMDILSESDPKCAVYEQVHGSWKKLEKTEKIKNTKDPDFKKPVEMNYYFEKTQRLKFVFEDGDDGDNDKIGEHEVVLARIMTKSEGYTGELQRHGQGGRGQLFVRAEAVASSRTHVNFSMEWTGLDSKLDGLCGMCREPQDVYFEFTKETPEGSFVRTWKSRDYKKYREIQEAD